MKSRVSFVIVVIAALAAGGVWAAGLAGETLGGLKLGDMEKTLLDKYGPPETKFSLGNDPSGKAPANCWEYGYESKGMIVLVCADDAKGTRARVNGVIAGGGSKARTGRGIGSGSGKAEVVKAYGQLQYDGDVGYITDTASGCGISFRFAADKVVEVMLRKIGQPGG